MVIKRILVTGASEYINRRQGLFQAMSLYFERVECLPSGELFQFKVLDILARGYYNKILERISPNTADRFAKNQKTFITRSRNTERKIRQLEYVPDLVFHVFCMFCPFWDKFDIPYVIYLDYTMGLAKKNWSPWAPFKDEKEFTDWLDCEKVAYQQATHIFTLGNIVKKSLIEDYGIQSEKITVVGSSSRSQKLYQGEKSFGSKQILFNGSEFERKGGSLVLAAFRQVKKVLPEAKLVIIGEKLAIRENGVENPGYISSADEKQNLFLKSDLVVAPAYCEPYGLFLVEAFNYGVPCIVSDNDGMPDIVDDGVNGIVIPEPTADILAVKIINLLSNISMLKAMSLNAQHKVKTQLNWDVIGKKVSQVLATIS
ncbi:glycosyltransferase family 4 protein [Nostoc sp. CENA67]|uniref:Glycosyltransferase family 4 protein n=1 Tax=Amazonocrinis nigriterrae CENA67 TaxID=2794033 RepID=A0A8J7LAA3_9NOST|nr:glycosyltransferase family 4 protein [Amazonocrinis nigriterrae]MBH8562371.1 glycosyltransferase family 4 protein [Amazonocrinis nigriterrae CENA67]MBH8562408.1 glycosyltransferase family 4 protein [Amazonocrinis nigriterrae CENA67]